MSQVSKNNGVMSLTAHPNYPPYAPPELEVPVPPSVTETLLDPIEVPEESPLAWVNSLNFENDEDGNFSGFVNDPEMESDNEYYLSDDGDSKTAGEHEWKPPTKVDEKKTETMNEKLAIEMEEEEEGLDSVDKIACR